MNVAVWIATALLATAFLAAGSMKLVNSRERLVASGQGWAADFPARVVKVIGTAEVLGAAGLLLPALLDFATWLVPLAAVGLSVMMIGAIAVHAKRREMPNIAINFVLLTLALFVAVMRFGPQSF